MNVKTLEVGSLDTNCYILNIDDNYLIVDPGDNFESIKNEIKGKLLGVLLTHHHFDHVGALDKVLEYYNVPLYDCNYLSNNKINNIGPFNFRPIYNPGHTLDSVSFYFEKEKIMFVGDFVFAGSIGRCDLGGDESLMKESLTKLITLDKDIRLLPGHGPITTLGNEIDNIKYFISIL